MLLGIFAAPSDPLAEHIAGAAAARGWSARVIALPDPSRPVTSDLASWLVDGDEVEACDAFVLRQFPSSLATPHDPSRATTRGDAWRAQLRDVERAHVAESALLEMELRGKPVINPFALCAPFERKPLQLAAFE